MKGKENKKEINICGGNNNKNETQSNNLFLFRDKSKHLTLIATINYIEPWVFVNATYALNYRFLIPMH